MVCKSIFDFSSDHSPIIVYLNDKLVETAQTPHLCSKNTNAFQVTLQEHFYLKIPLRCEQEIEQAVEHSWMNASNTRYGRPHQFQKVEVININETYPQKFELRSLKKGNLGKTGNKQGTRLTRQY